jgi:beta-lactamase class A
MGARERTSFRKRRIRRRRARALLALFVAVLAAALAWRGLPALERTGEEPVPAPQRVGAAREPSVSPLGAPDPPELTLAGHAYEAVAGELPGVRPGDVGGVRQSVLDPAWASARIEPAGLKSGRYYAVFLHREGGSWRAERSVLIENQAHPKDVKTLLEGIPDDLVSPLFPRESTSRAAEGPAARAVQEVERATGREEWEAGEVKSSGPYHRVRVREENGEAWTSVYLRGEELAAIGREITSAELPGFPRELVEEAQMASPEPSRIPPPDPVARGLPEGKYRERVERVLEEAAGVVREHPGIAGFYVRDLKSGAGYGVRPDQVFFSASTIKVPVMIAVYRRIDQGRLDYSDRIVTTEEDWAAGAGWLRWQTPGAKSTVEDALWLMITQSDNVATNALVRLVGGPGYVNEVARSLGAKGTVLHWKLSSERAAIPSLDNRTTPRDMALLLAKIRSEKAASRYACREMLGLLEQNNLEWWIEGGVPPGVKVANKGGWLDSTYNDAGIVEYEERPYVLTVFTEYGPGLGEGGRYLQRISRAIWLAQSGKTLEEYNREHKEKDETTASGRPSSSGAPSP